MDFNVKLINIVKDNPVLYNGKSSESDKQKCWLGLSDKLRLSAGVLKNRWHFLMNAYKSELQQKQKELRSNCKIKTSTFKYLSDMEFLLPYLHPTLADTPPKKLIKLNNAEAITPEFVITEKDLENTEDDDDEFIFMEIESLDESLDVAAETKVETEYTLYDIQKQLEDEPDEVESQPTTNTVDKEAKHNYQEQFQKHAHLQDQTIQNEQNQQKSDQDKQHREVLHKEQQQLSNIDKPKKVEHKPQQQTQKQNNTVRNSENPQHQNPKKRLLSSHQLEGHNYQKTPTTDTTKEKESVPSPERQTTTTQSPPLPQSQSPEKPPNEDKEAIKEKIVKSPQTQQSPEEVTKIIRKRNSPINSHKASAHVHKKLKQRKTDRNQEDIFGELVASMLKPMAPEKKRQIKRDIMNILLA